MLPANKGDDPKTCTERRSIVIPEEMEKHLIARNRKHFGQAKGNFPTIPPFSEHVNWAASTHEADLILEGEYENEEIQGIGKIFIEHMQRTTKLDSISGYLTENEWVGKMKVWRESTSTSPSKLHIGHHKILIYKFDDGDKIEDNTSRWDFLRTTIEAQDHHEPPQQQPPSLEEMRIALLLAQIGLMNYAINHGYVYKRWTSVVNMMILKEENNTKIHQLRVIHLYKADYNLLLGVKWRQLMHHTVNNHLLHPSQYGGTPGRDSITPVLITEMQYEITRATRKPFVTLDFDATSCYDRIIESVASLAARSFGPKKSLFLVHARHLQEA